HEESPTQKTSPIGGRASWLKYYIENFDILDVGLLLTLSRPLRVNVHGGFHSIDTDPVVALSFSTASLTYQYSAEHLNPAYR
ncbi:ABC transporter D family member, partial [Trifolium medium]|nr:ABC transporter D family member [Trifolium medium]